MFRLVMFHAQLFTGTWQNCKKKDKEGSGSTRETQCPARFHGAANERNVSLLFPKSLSKQIRTGL